MPRKRRQSVNPEALREKTQDERDQELRDQLEELYPKTRGVFRRWLRRLLDGDAVERAEMKATNAGRRAG